MIKYLTFLCVSLCVILYACKSDVIDPPNPYDGINSGGTNPPVEPDPNSITGLHKNIFNVKCNNPGCHDGNFEPDFRSVQSTYSSLVYHKVIKNNSQGTFNYRVIPFDVNNSWLHERLVTGDSVLGRMPLYSTPLNSTELGHINNWISNGARDINGNVSVLPSYPNQEPELVAYAAFDGNGTRIDTNRVDGIAYNPFIVPSATNMTIYFVLQDDSTAVENLLQNQLKLSTSIDDFSNPVLHQATYVLLGNLKLWFVTFNTSSLTTGGIYYMRYFARDPQHAVATGYPTNSTLSYIKSVYSFKIQ